MISTAPMTSEFFHAFVEGEIPLYEGKLMEQFKISPSAPEFRHF